MLAISFILSAPGGATYETEIEQWREGRESRLKADDGWLTVVGLFWLKDGANTVGADAANAIVLPPGSAPAKVGAFHFHAGVATFEARPGVEVTVNGKRIASAPLAPDTTDSPDVLQLHDLTMFVIKRGERYAIRLKDKNSALRKSFAGLRYFPTNPSYQVRARFVPYTPPKTIAVPNILGETEPQVSPGYVVFTLQGHEFQLDPVTEGDLLFFIFKDLTAGQETYPAGRFLYTERPRGGEVVLDFNKAYNPPCAFTPFATCPLPPKQNYLPLRIEAGELRYGH